MGKVVNLNECEKKLFEKTFELEGLDEELLELAMKLAACDPSKNVKKKDIFKEALRSKLTKGGAEQLIDSELDLAAGGVGVYDGRETDSMLELKRKLKELERPED